MSIFRDQLALDRDAVFLNIEEFGEPVVITVEGGAPVTVTAVRDDDLTTPRTRGPDEAEGVFARRTVLHLAAGLITRPVEGQRLTLGSGAAAERWYVVRVSEAEGMLEVALERQET